jgi:hypothetical protein
MNRKITGLTKMMKIIGGRFWNAAIANTSDMIRR